MPIRPPALLSTVTRRWYLWLTGIGLALLATAGALLAASLTGVIAGGEEPGLVEFGQSDATTSTGFSLEVDRLARYRVPTPEPSRAQIARLLIPRIGVDAPVVVVGVDGNGVMQSPKGPEEVGWYNFTSQPGFGGNAVFSGHVDYRNYGPAVFWELRNLRPGDLVEVRLADGTSYTYAVVRADSYKASEAPVGEIVGPTPRESLTLITCGGTFDRGVRQYSHRLVVRAERL